MRRCRSTTGSAAPPASAARRRSRKWRPAKCSAARIAIRFDSNVAAGLPWKFEPEQNEIKVRIGEVATVHYKVMNEAARQITAQASYNVTPPTIGAYFTKINCFCFTQQTMKAGETREMTVVFYVDPAIVKDHEQDDLNTITLSYTFYRLPDPAPPVADASGNEFQALTETTMAEAHANHHDYHLVIRARGRRSAPSRPSSWRSAPSAGCTRCTPPRRWCSASA